MPIIRVRWTDKESQQILYAAAKKFNEGYNLGEALKIAQLDVLPEDRRRPLSSLYASSKLTRAIRKLANSWANKPFTLAQEKPATPPPVTQVDASLDALFNAMARKIAETIKIEVVKVVKELEHEFKVAKHNPEYEPVGKKRPKIVIIGLQPMQETMIHQEYASRYDMKFMHTDDAKHQSATDADAYLLMKNFISHSVFERYQIFKNHVLIDGGMTALRGWLSTEGSKL